MYTACSWSSLVRTMTPPALTRYPSFPRDTTSHPPTAPIPIPNMRRVTDPPPRSPTRFGASPDLIFEMSPHVSDETPLTQHRNPLALGDIQARFAQKATLPFASRFGHTRSPTVNLPPYWEEPFLYSIPRPPTRLPLGHNRTQSAIVQGSTRVDSRVTDEKEELTIAIPSSFTLKSLYSTDAQSVRGSDSSHSEHDPDDEILTSAFQQSFTSTESSRSSLSSSKVHFQHPLSPPPSLRNEKPSKLPVKFPALRSKKNTVSSSGLASLVRTTAAEPVVSFAQAELKHSPSSGMVARVVKLPKESPKSPLRARSPYPPFRGRRNSAVQTRTSKISDEDIAGTLGKSDTPEKLGFERFLPMAFLRRPTADENALTTEETLERGRTKSRQRGGRRL